MSPSASPLLLMSLSPHPSTPTLLTPSFYTSLRTLHRSIHTSLKNHVFSILHDIKELQNIINLKHLGLQRDNIFMNLRTGAWYDLVRESEARDMEYTPNYCYFQSKNGHSETMAFSTMRFNPHVLRAAVKYHSACIVDATRRGKIYPDSISKTIPIWMTVLNRQVLGWKDARIETHMKFVSRSEYERAMQVVEEFVMPPAVIRKMRQMVLAELDNADEWEIPFLSAERSNAAPRSKRLYLKPIFINPTHPYDASHHEERDHLAMYLISASETERESKQQGTYTYLPGAGDDHEAWIPHKDFSAEVFWKHFDEIDPHEDMTEEELKERCLSALENDSPRCIAPVAIHNPTIFIAELMKEEYVHEFDVIIQFAAPKTFKEHERPQAKHVHQFSVCNNKKFKTALQKHFDQILSCIEKVSQRVLVVSMDPKMGCYLSAYATAILLNMALFEAPDFRTARGRIEMWSGSGEQLKALCMMCQMESPQNFLSQLLYKQMKKVIHR